LEDRIAIRDLEVECVVGVFEEERNRAQKVYLDVEFAVDVAAAAGRQDLAGLFDYYRASHEIRDLVVEGRYHLIESMAEAVARYAIEELSVPEVLVRVKKPGALPEARQVEVRITRRRG